MVSSGINKGIHCDCSLIIPDDFNGSEITHDRITQQLSKTLDTPFFAKNIYIDDDFSFTCPVSMINELRRDVLADLEDAVVDSYLNPLLRLLKSLWPEQMTARNTNLLCLLILR